MSCKALGMHLFMYSFGRQISTWGLLCVGRWGRHRKSVVHKTDKSLPSTHWQHWSRQTRKPATETVVHMGRGNNPSFLCLSLAVSWASEIISSWLSSVFFPDTRNYIFIRKADGQALSSSSHVLAGLSTLSRYITLVIPALLSHLKSEAHALNKAQ